MIKPGALVMAAAMTAVSAGTYFGLNLLPPGLLPPPIGRVQPPAPPKPGTAPAAAPAETAAAPAPAAPAPAEPAPAEQPVTEQDLAEEPPPPAPTEQAAAKPAPEPEPEPEPTQPAAQQAPALDDAPAARPAPAPAPKKRPAVEVVREDSSASGTQVAKAGPTGAPKAPKQAPPESDVIKPWWPDASKQPANQLKLQYAGQVQGEQAIALLFSAPLNVDSLRQHAQVKTESGQAVSGGWELGKNPRLAVFRGVESGRYTVLLGPQVADAKGFMLGQKLTGPVYVQPSP